MLAKDHLLQVLDLVDGQGFTFILETNGIPLGQDDDYTHQLARYGDIHVRVSLKAGTPQGFQERTGARGEFWELPYQAIESLQQAGVSFHVAAMTDSRLMPAAERERLLQKLEEVGYGRYLEQEVCDPYPSSLVRLEAAGFDIF